MLTPYTHSANVKFSALVKRISGDGADAWLTHYQAILGPLYTLFLPFGFRVEGWHFTIRHLSGSRRVVEASLMTLSTLAWLAPVARLSWWWLVVFLLSQSLAGLYLALAIAPNHKGMPTWPPAQPFPSSNDRS